MKVRRLIGAIFLSTLLCSCAGQQQTAAPVTQMYNGVTRMEGVSIESVRQEAMVTSGYDNILLNPIQMPPQYAIDYPEMSNQFQIGMLSLLRDKNEYKQVGDAKYWSGNQAKGKTLVVDIDVIDMRIVSKGARFWAGAMAGSSYMDLYLKLSDAASGKLLHEKVITTSNNAFASAWAIGSEDALPIDMGKIIGEYVYTVAPTK